MRRYARSFLKTFGDGAAWRNLALFSTPGGWWAFDDTYWKFVATGLMAGCAIVAQFIDTHAKAHPPHHEP
jgi:hypothetical protein